MEITITGRNGYNVSTVATLIFDTLKKEGHTKKGASIGVRSGTLDEERELGGKRIKVLAMTATVNIVIDDDRERGGGRDATTRTRANHKAGPPKPKPDTPPRPATVGVSATVCPLCGSGNARILYRSSPAPSSGSCPDCHERFDV